MALSEPHIVLVGGDGAPSGVPRHITDLVRALRARARITVFSEADRGGYADLSGLGAAHVVVPGLSSGLTPGHWRRARAALAGALADHPADLVWAHARLPVIALRQVLLSGRWVPPAETRLALSYHGLPFGRGHRPGTSALARRMERHLLQNSPPLDLVFLTDAQRDRMAAIMGPALAAHRCHVLGNASHLGPPPAEGSAAPRPDGRHLVMTGRTGWQKNYPAALRLMRLLPADITLTLCGAGTDSRRFAAQVRRLAGPAAPRVRCMGPVRDVRPLLAQADGYMLLSRYEGQPIGALEASEYGLPLIVADFDGAAALTKDHPMALRLTGTLPAQARAIDGLLTRYVAARPGQSAAIRAFWAARYAPDRFAAQARALLQEGFGL